MEVSVESLQGLEYKTTISIANTEVEKKVKDRLNELARKVQLPGFRPGKVPMTMVQTRFSKNALEEVAQDLVKSTLSVALEEKQLTPVALPQVELQQLELGKDFIYHAVFEILPTITIKELTENDSLELIRAEIQEKDIDALIEKLREENKNWQEVSRPAILGDKITMDFEGFINEKEFKDGKAQNHEVILGSHQLIPGFEEKLVGREKDTPFEIQVKFPADYKASELADKDAVFKITIKTIQEGTLPELNNDFFEKFNVSEGGLEGFRKELRETMSQQLETKVSSLNRETIFNEFLKANPIELPKALVKREIDVLKHEFYHQLFGAEHHPNEKIPDFPDMLFEERAKRRVHLGLLFSEYIKLHHITVDAARIKTFIDKIVSAYDDPESIKKIYQNERLAEVEALLQEEMIAEKISAQAACVEKHMAYEEVIKTKSHKNGANLTEEPTLTREEE